MVRKIVIVGLVLIPVLSVTVSPGAADDSCKKVFAQIRNYTGLIEDPTGVCQGYDLCAFGDTVGTLRGSISFFQMYEWFTVVADGAAGAFWDKVVVETNRGSLLLDERGIFQFGAPGPGIATHMLVTEGSGRYVGATGWMASIPTSESRNFLLRGEICTNSD